MAETPYLVDSNILLRWVKPNYRDYPLIVLATDAAIKAAAAQSRPAPDTSLFCPYS